MHINPNCKTCNGDGVVESSPAGAGHEDDLAEYLPCPVCRDDEKKIYIPSAHPKD